MSAINGNTGSVSFQVAAAEVFLHVNAFSFDWNREEHDVTAFDSTDGWKDKIPGLTKITGTLEGWYQDAGEAALVGSKVITDGATVVLTASTGRTYTFTAGVNLTNLSFQTETGIPNKWTANFTANVKPTVA